jgi:hypothetical protein
MIIESLAIIAVIILIISAIIDLLKCRKYYLSKQEKDDEKR